ncbi:MAG: hypothetical protein M3442_04155, partial [Chloroflexota bacterium]|nr:hypothetical protein [Chloroflexota bacterium]
MSESPSGREPDAADPTGADAGSADAVRPFSGGSGRKERGGFNPSRLGEAARPSSVIPKIVGGGQVVRAGAPVSPPPLVPPASPAQRVLQERDSRAEPQGYTDVRIIGVGGGGGNAVNRMIEAGVQGVEFVVVNTDAQSLEASPARRKIQLSAHATLRLGAGGDPGAGRQAAEASE